MTLILDYNRDFYELESDSDEDGDAMDYNDDGDLDLGWSNEHGFLGFHVEKRIIAEHNGFEDDGEGGGFVREALE